MTDHQTAAQRLAPHDAHRLSATACALISLMALALVLLALGSMQLRDDNDMLRSSCAGTIGHTVKETR